MVNQPRKISDFNKFLKVLNSKYPVGTPFVLNLDNHSAHTSKETRRFLATLPEDRFVFVFSPTHTSWLNMPENFIIVMTKQVLKDIHENSKVEPSEQICRSWLNIGFLTDFATSTKS